MKSYTESSAQTIQIDPDCHLKNYEYLKSVSLNNNKKNDYAQKTACAQTKQNNEENSDNKKDDNDNGESCSTSSSCSSSSSSSVDQEQELQRRLNPTQHKDFQVLKTELLQWRKREERKIIITARNDLHRSDMKKQLLKKEAHLLRKIDQLKNNAAGKCRTKKIEHVLILMSEPKQWEVSNGEIINVDTPETCRARELKDMYDELHEKVDKVRKRIEILERIKALVDNINHCGLAKDVGSLLERELQMLHNGTDLGPDLINGLRKRLSNQFTKLATKLNSDGRIEGGRRFDTESTAKFQLHKPDAISQAGCNTS